MIDPEVWNGQADLQPGVQARGGTQGERAWGDPLAGSAREIGVKQQTLHRWKRFDGRLPSEKAGEEKPASSELERLRRENIKLRAERDILKKALGYFAKEPQ
jgi:transposase